MPIRGRLLSIREYQKMAKTGILNDDDRVELLNGKIIEMSPIGSLHAACVNRINALFSKALGSKVIVSLQNPLVIPPYSMPEPDVVLLKPREDYYARRHPRPKDVLLVLEVADSTLQKDKTIKKLIYAQAGIQEYWIVDIPNKKVQVFRSPAEKEFQMVESFSPNDRLKLSGLDFSFLVREILP